LDRAEENEKKGAATERSSKAKKSTRRTKSQKEQANAQLQAIIEELVDKMEISGGYEKPAYVIKCCVFSPSPCDAAFFDMPSHNIVKDDTTDDKKN
jgi:hypothetical protein